MKTIDYSSFIAKVNDRNSSIKLLNALEPSPIRRYQIPNSLNILQREEIEEKLNKDDEIIVYCTETACNQSTNLYYLLEHMGYKNVTRFSGGLREWFSKGQALEEIFTSSAA